MKLISYDDLLSVMSREKLDRLPTIDPVEIIEEMKKEIGVNYNDINTCLQIDILDELLQKFNPSSHV